MLLVVQTLEVILQCCPKEAAALLKPALAKLLASILGNQELGLVQASKRSCPCCMQYSAQAASGALLLKCSVSRHSTQHHSNSLCSVRPAAGGTQAQPAQTHSLVLLLC